MDLPVCGNRWTHFIRLIARYKYSFKISEKPLKFTVDVCVV